MSDGWCASCAVDTGECPNCGTFWIRPVGGKRYGIRPVDRNAWVAAGRDTRHPGELSMWPNVIERVRR